MVARGQAKVFRFHRVIASGEESDVKMNVWLWRNSIRELRRNRNARLMERGSKNNAFVHLGSR